MTFFTQLIWWIRTRQIFKKFDQGKMFQNLLYTLSNLFDSTNLMKLIWLCISGDLSIADWFKQLCYFCFLVKNSFGKTFFKTCISVNLFVFFALYPVIFWKKQCFFYFQWSLSLRCLPWFSHTVMFWAPDFSTIWFPVITRTSKETKTRWSSGEILSSVSPV